jgi:hypothetical protein
MECAAEATLCGAELGFIKDETLPATKPTTTAAKTMPILAPGLEACSGCQTKPGPEFLVMRRDTPLPE